MSINRLFKLNSVVNKFSVSILDTPRIDIRFYFCLGLGVNAMFVMDILLYNLFYTKQNTFCFTTYVYCVMLLIVPWSRWTR